ncbi:aspartyl-phosphate phosphatase Spo0E family protein [Anaerobacillus sp. CMMVII]|uniref:aspartyl-phosphate phosphatase Spo0E family protein n=1 Tax=Anaerobacillus sp. CMMVII TaxID=2755588 RepID=UPI0021B7587E|nr:aspartyl-phosphate phosphatase Spo0E family protein [Anaerobacillus sp. CMMVII]MCT8136490.1 aspartyl-phosphate phosphatase Spo0E family protein [Anaerobacillus sp. CMMVII]
MKKNYNNDIMLEEIEIARKHMIKLAYDYPLSSDEVVDASTRLDKLLNVFNKIAQEK